MANTPLSDTYHFMADMWEVGTNIPPPARYGHTGAVLLNKFYVVYGSDGANLLQDTQEYDGSTWVTRSAAPPPARMDATGSEMNFKLYVTGGRRLLSGEGGGNVPVSDTVYYTVDTWTTTVAAPLPARFLSASAVL